MKFIVLKQIANDARGARASEFERSRAWFKRAMKSEARVVALHACKGGSWKRSEDMEAVWANMGLDKLIFDFWKGFDVPVEAQHVL